MHSFAAIISWLVATYNLVAGVSTLEVLTVLVVGGTLLSISSYLAKVIVVQIYDSTSMSKNTAEYLCILFGGDEPDIEPKNPNNKVGANNEESEA